MKIERVDDSTIKCFLSLEELKDYQVDYKDFLSRSDQAQKLMHDIIEQARDEVGYRPPHLAFEMQIMMVPDQGLVLTFSEKEPFDFKDDKKVANFMSSIKELLKRLKEYRGELGDGGFDPSKYGLEEDELPFADTDGPGFPGFPGMPEEALDQMPFGPGSSFPGDRIPGFDSEGSLMPAPGDPKGPGRREPRSPQEEAAPEVLEAVFIFSNIGKVMQFSAGLPARLRIESELYKMDDYYYLHICKGHASYDRFSRICVQALEFAALYGADKGCDAMLKEHAELLIAEKAVAKLR